MNTEKNIQLVLEQIPADRTLVEELYSHGLITQPAREFALQLLYPPKNWGLWVSRLLLIVGISLILTGIIFLSAFNWTQITPITKFSCIQLSIFGCLVATYRYGLKQLSGKILLLSASVLVGVFLATFSQTYQTGADSYNFFMMWSLLIAGWVVISEFAVLWAMWLVIINIFLTLYWYQAALPDREIETITSALTALNLICLGLREYYVHKKNTEWLAERWTCIILVIPILICLLIPTIWFIVWPDYSSLVIKVEAICCLIAHVGLFITYRYKLPDMWPLSTIVLSGCTILELAGFKLLNQIFYNNTIVFLLAGIMTISIFAIGVFTLRHIVKNIKVTNV